MTIVKHFTCYPNELQFTDLQILTVLYRFSLKQVSFIWVSVKG
jgi:hypothetical protein